ncbi:glycerate dehydrogenase [Paecilomyces variotii No. 5]|uniref:Glycerate dehydrogenase n=1 Tax=Byssochlamys spectabilis (strain No. 5 / NBRC 109023) TaxID=1356009 RepID=V5I5Z7_BYSSN|nr:glycerate dehydrogenase [Paecilomyces variotii No. 5]
MGSPPSPTHHNIVMLQTQYFPCPHFDLPPQYTKTEFIYKETPRSELHARIHDATIIVLATTRLDAVALSPEVTPYLKFIAITASGTDCIDLDACRKRGIVVSNSPGVNIEAVSEHAIGLYFAARRKVLQMHNETRRGAWVQKSTLMFDMLNKDGTAPLTCEEEVAGVIGYGVVGKLSNTYFNYTAAVSKIESILQLYKPVLKLTYNIGKRIAHLAQSLGMKVLISGRKGAGATALPSALQSEERTPFEEIIRKCTVIFVVVPRNSSTIDLISTPEFKSMSQHTVVINVARGGIVNEEALVAALKENLIAGAATDVFFHEPASPENSVLLREDTADLNLTVSPHMAWVAERTQQNLVNVTKKIVEGWVAGQPCNVVI